MKFHEMDNLAKSEDSSIALVMVHPDIDRKFKGNNTSIGKCV